MGQKRGPANVPLECRGKGGEGVREGERGKRRKGESEGGRWGRAQQNFPRVPGPIVGGSFCATPPSVPESSLWCVSLSALGSTLQCWRGDLRSVLRQRREGPFKALMGAVLHSLSANLRCRQRRPPLADPL